LDILDGLLAFLGYVGWLYCFCGCFDLLDYFHVIISLLVTYFLFLIAGGLVVLVCYVC
jgi:hypothetical protein